MKRVLAAAAVLVCLWGATPVLAGIIFQYEQSGSTVPTDCPPGFPPQPVCTIIDATGVANDVPDTIPGQWLFHLNGMVLNFQGSGTFEFDDPSPADNDFFGTWTNVLFPPNGQGIAHTTFQWVVTGGSGMFLGLTGNGISEGDVVVIPVPVAACDRAQPGIGSYCDAGQFHITEPTMLPLLVLAMTAMLTSGVLGRFRSPSSRPA